MHLSDNLNHSKRFPSKRRGGKGGLGPETFYHYYFFFAYQGFFYQSRYVLMIKIQDKRVNIFISFYHQTTNSA